MVSISSSISSFEIGFGLIDCSQQVEVCFLGLRKQGSFADPVPFAVVQKLGVQLIEIASHPRPVGNTVVASKKHAILQQQRHAQILSTSHQITVMQQQCLRGCSIDFGDSSFGNLSRDQEISARAKLVQVGKTLLKFKIKKKKKKKKK
jgi:hypothetical protein